MKNGIFQEGQESRKQISVHAKIITLGLDDNVLMRGHWAIWKHPLPPLISQDRVKERELN